MSTPTFSPAITYTTAQLKAIDTIDNNLQVVACAGSGKTDVVSERVADILRRKWAQKIGPGNIVAFTFTDRAAAELKERIVQKVHGKLGEIPGMAEMFVGTIHGYCLQLLQTYVPKYFRYSVLNEIQARLLVDRFPKKSGLSSLNLKRWVESGLYLHILGILREADVDFQKLKGHPAVDALRQYQALLDEHGYLDYTEIMVQALNALRTDNQLRTQIKGRVKFLTVDEYQDVNPLQEALVRTIHDLGANVCVVGDDDQTIYQWRGSNAENILLFDTRNPGVSRVPIEENYRSSDGIVEAARLVIEHNNPNRLAKSMISAHSQSFEAGDLLFQRFRSPIEEAKWIARKAKSLIGVPFVDKPNSSPRGLAPSDIAVLLRSVKRTGEPIVKALQDAGLPVVVVGMTSLFDRAEVHATVTLFEFMAGQTGRQELKDTWIQAKVGAKPKRLEAAIQLMEQRRQWDPSERWGVYGLQRTLLMFLEELQLREEQVPGGRGEVVYFNLGKFSQVISDYEQIHFATEPQAKYEAFVGFLRYQAPDYYPEGWQDSAYVKPDAVQVMTIHQAKGMEWPVVFVPCLQRNRFPAKGHGGKGAWHVIPKQAVGNASRYDGSVEDERRLFYVALTRGKKYLFCSWGPDGGNQLYRSQSEFVGEFTAYPKVLTREPSRPSRVKVTPRPRREVVNIALSFSDLKYYFECPYEFKLRFLYGFNPPIAEALGYGKSLHDALAEIHKRALQGDIVTESMADELMERHLHAPFAYEELRRNLKAGGAQAIRKYLRTNKHLLDKIEHVEQVIELDLGQGIVVNGRIDLIRRLDTNETIVVDFKSSDRAQGEDVTRTQLHIHTLGYKNLTGKAADLIEVYNLDKGHSERERVDSKLEQETTKVILKAGGALRDNHFERLRRWSQACAKCDVVGICRIRQK